jgi:beta-galactosidase
VDVISEEDELTGYELVVVPTMYVLAKATIDNLEGFAKAGGTVVFTGLTGVKDQHNAVVNMKLPGLAAKMSGIEVEEYISMPHYEENEIQFNHPELEDKYPVPIWADVLEPKEAVPIAKYTQDFFADKSAASINIYGDGKVIYLGALGEFEYYADITRWLLTMTGIAPLLNVPAGVEITERWQGEQRLLFLLNHTEQEQKVDLEEGFTNLTDGKDAKETVIIPPLDVLILAAKSL